METATPVQEAEAKKTQPPVEEFVSAIPEPYHVLGLRLLPLSIGRYRRLARHKIAFVSPEKKNAEIGDLILGVLICSMRCDEFDRIVLTPEFPKAVKRWGRRVMPAPFMSHFKWLYPFWNASSFGRRWRSKHDINILEKFRLFSDYINDAQKMPRFYAKNASTKTATAHWADNVEMILRSELGWNAEEINEQPLSKALADYVNWACQNDLVDLITDEDLITAKENEQRIAEAVAKWEAKHGA